jgi:endoglucanase
MALSRLARAAFVGAAAVVVCAPVVTPVAADAATRHTPARWGRPAATRQIPNPPATWGRPRHPAPVPTDNPFVGHQLYVDPYSLAAQNKWQSPTLIGKIAAQPQASWFDYSQTGGGLTNAIRNVTSTGKMAVLVAYAIPNRDCAGPAPWAAPDEAHYDAWITALAQGIGAAPAAIVLEPDALAQLASGCQTDGPARERMLAFAVSALRANAPNTATYLDAGHAGWIPAATMAPLLTASGVANARGFSLNVSNFSATSAELAYGSDLSARIDGRHFVVDTSRNGVATAGSNWCNPSGQALGVVPTSATGSAAADAYLWIKRPGESDGNASPCRPTDPPAGSWFESYAEGLASHASW